MSLTISVADNQDGSGVTVTISGSLGGSVSVYYQPVALLNQNQAFTLGGTRTGDGTVSLSIPVGYYWFYAITGSTISNLVYQVASDNASAVHERAIQAVKARIQGLSMAGLPSSQVYDQLFPNETNIIYPAILLTIESMPETQPGTLTGQDDIGYPVRVSICDRIDPNDASKRETYLMWRQQISRALRNQRLTGIPENAICFVEPDVVAAINPGYALYISGLIVRFISRENRGT